MVVGIGVVVAIVVAVVFVAGGVVVANGVGVGVGSDGPAVFMAQMKQWWLVQLVLIHRPVDKAGMLTQCLPTLGSPESSNRRSSMGRVSVC